jgi:hypothetical protein
LKPVGIAIVVAQSFASINVPEASTWATEKAETIGPISWTVLSTRLLIWGGAGWRPIDGLAGDADG